MHQKYNRNVITADAFIDFDSSRRRN